MILDNGNAIKWYRKRIAMGGWFEEVYYSYYRIARCKLGMKRSWGEIQQAYEEAHKYLPSRMEPVFEIGKYYQENENYPEAYKWLIKASKIPFPSDQVLFLFKDIYEFRVWDALGIAAYYIGQYQDGINACIKALKSSFCTSERERIKDNMRFSLEKLKK
jgi:tetratricopeptide (TPR) repeat protein